MPSPLELIHALESTGRRRAPTVANLRELMAHDAAIPERSELTKNVMTGFKRAKVPDRIHVRSEMPEIESGTIFDYSTLEEPHGYLERYRLPVAARGITDKLLPAFRGDTMQKNRDYIRRGAELGGAHWYNHNPRNEFVERYLAPEDRGRAHEMFSSMPAWSPQASPMAEMRNATFLNWFRKRFGRSPSPEEFREHSAGIPMASSISDLIGNSEELIEHGSPRAWMRTSLMDRMPKVGPYGMSSDGNLYVPAMDTHSLQGLGLEKNQSPSNKGGAALILQELAARSGHMPSDTQAMQWIGKRAIEDGESTRNLAPKDLLLDRMIRYDAQQKGAKPTQHAIDILGGDDHLGSTNFKRGGRVFMSGGGLLEKYIKSRLPDRLKTSGSLTHLPDYGGSSREVFGLGNDKLVKVAKRPRGLHEQSLEGDRRVEGNLPKLFWRDPDNELTVLEHMKHTPNQSMDFMEPMMRQYMKAADSHNGFPNPNWMRVHREDPLLSRMMDSSGLGAFKQFDVHGPDFFSAADHHWSMRDPKSPNPMTRGATLLDPGALDHRITNPQFERTFAGKFGNLANERLRRMGEKSTVNNLIDEAMYPTKAGNLGGISDLDKYGLGRGVEDFIGAGARWPQPIGPETNTDEIARLLRGKLPRDTGRAPGNTFDDRQSLDFRAGGGFIDAAIARARDHLAGGGPPRNWLRGVKGSGIDEALNDLKGHRLVRDPNEGGTWAAGTQTPEVLAANAKRSAMKQWIDKNLANYVVRQMGTDADPLMKAMGPTEAAAHRAMVSKIKAADVPDRFKDIYEKQGWFGYSAEDREKHLTLPPWLQKLAEQDQPRAWSDKQYQLAYPSTVSGNENHRSTALKELEEKYQRRNAPPVLLHDLDKSSWDRGMGQKMRDVLDHLSTNVDPASLPRVSVEQAVRGSDEWHAELAKKQRDAVLSGAGMKVHKEYPGGMRWMKYDPESIPKAKLFGDRKEVLKSHEMSTAAEEALRAQLKAEGEAMGHCVGDYCDDVVGGATHIYSLRDAKGQPHVTVEVTPKEMSQFKRNVLAGEDGLTDAQLEQPHDIVQIKGKGNKKPIDEYLPYVQDFVRSGKWGSVGDIKNTGLDEITSTTGKTHYMTPEESAPFSSQWPHSPRDSNGAPLEVKKGPGRYVRGDNFVDYTIPDDWSPGYVAPKNFASGGQVDDLRAKIDAALTKSEVDNELQPGLMHALAMKESTKNPNAIGKAGEVGILQFMPKTAKNLGLDPKDPFMSISIGGTFLRKLIDRFGLAMGLAAYNTGEPNVMKGKIPDSTKEYVSSILARLGTAPQLQDPGQKPGTLQAAPGLPTAPAQDDSQNEMDGAMGMLEKLLMGDEDDDMLTQLMGEEEMA